MSSCPVDIWTIDLDAPRPLALNADEQARAARFRFEKDRRHWGNARSALRQILSGYLGMQPLDFEFIYGKDGKPALQSGGLEFNISHSRNWAMFAVTQSVPVGIDLEWIRESVDIANLLRRIGETRLTGSTEELFRVWTRREARTKAVGGPLMEIPDADLRVADLVAPECFAASLALLGVDPAPCYRHEGSSL
jgi:4'-phosphopantetheinyl transferase